MKSTLLKFLLLLALGLASLNGALSWDARPASAAPSKDDPPIRGPLVDPPDAYPHAPAVFTGELRYQPTLPAQAEPLEALPQPLRLTPGENRKPFAPQLAYWIDSVAQTEPGPGAMPVPLPGFAGLNFAQDGAGWPPDTVGDASLTHYIQAVNISVGIFELPSGALRYRATFNRFFTGPADTPCDEHHRGDPVVLYDPYVQRWLVTDFAWYDDRPGFYQCLAVSRSADPLAGGWHFYALRADTGGFINYLNDYPKLGVGRNGWYMTANMFQMGFPGGGFGVRVWALDRQAMIQGLPLREVHFDLCTQGDCASLLPAHDNLATAPANPAMPHYLLAARAPDQLLLWQLRADFDAPLNSTLSGPTIIPVAPFATAASIPQKDTWQVLDSLSSRLMMQLQYRYQAGIESLWVNHTVASGGFAGVRWYEIQHPASPAPLLAQQSTYLPDAHHRWMGSLAVDQDGNLALGYSISGEDLYPSIRLAGRMASETLSQLPQQEVEVKAGGGSQELINRWGDYSAMTVAPDGCTFYYTTEYLAETGYNWQTWVVPLRYPSCGQPKGWLQGVVRDDVTGQALAQIPVTVVSAQETLRLQSDSQGAFRFTLMAGGYTVTAGPLPPGYPFPAQASVNVDAGQTAELELRLQPYPSLTIAGQSLADAPPNGNQNQVPEPGESGLELQIALRNLGSIPAANVESQLISLTAGVNLTADQASYADIPPQQTQNPAAPYRFEVEDSLPCGAPLLFRQEVQDALQTYTFDLTFDSALTQPLETLFLNDVESGALLWRTSGVNNTWGILAASNLPSPSHAWTDSPKGNYKDNTDASLVTTVYNLSGKYGVRVGYTLKYAIEPGWDYLFVEYSLDGGQTWAETPLAFYTGFQSAWKTEDIPAPVLDNQPTVQLRFRLQSDVYVTYDGAVLDDITLRFEPRACLYPVQQPPAAPVPLAPMGGMLFASGLVYETTFRWQAGASGAPIEGYRLYLDGNLAADVPASQTQARLSVAPGEHRWTVEAYNAWGVSPQAAQTFFVRPYWLLLMNIMKP